MFRSPSQTIQTIKLDIKTELKHAKQMRIGNQFKQKMQLQSLGGGRGLGWRWGWEWSEHEDTKMISKMQYFYFLKLTWMLRTNLFSKRILTKTKFRRWITTRKNKWINIFDKNWNKPFTFKLCIETNTR